MLTYKKDIDSYIKGQLEDGQSVNGMVDHIIYDRVDIDNYIIAKHNGENINTITRLKKIGLVKNYILDVQKYGN